MEVYIEFVDGKSGTYDGVVDYYHRIVEIYKEREIIGFFPFEAIIALGYEEERMR